MSPLVIAHQLPPGFATQLTASLPDVSWRALAPEQAWQIPPDATVLLAMPQRGAARLPKPPGWPHGLRWVQVVSAGVDEFPPWIYEVEVVTCGRGSNSAPIAEYVLAGLLAVEKKLDQLWIHDPADWRKPELGTLEGKTLGLLGYGTIGQAVAARARPFGMRILATRRSGGQAEADVGFVGFDTLLKESDHLVIAAPLTNATAGLFGKAAFAQLKPGAHLVNIARGRIVDHAALLDALERGQLGFATLDVTEPEPLPAGHPLYTHPRVHLSPHLSWSSGERGRAFAGLFTANLERFRNGEALSGLVRADLGY